MKYCQRCNVVYNDNVNLCQRCGNNRLVYYQNGQNNIQLQKHSNLKLGEFIKAYFKSPDVARDLLINAKDYGSALIMNGISFVATFLFVLCFQGGLVIRYQSKFNAAILFIVPIFCFLFILGFEYLGIFLYSLASKSQNKYSINKAGACYISLSASQFLPCCIMAVASLFSLISPIMGTIIVCVVPIMELYNSIHLKSIIGNKPSNFLNSFLFILFGILTLVAIYGFILILVMIFANMGIQSTMNSLYSIFG